MEKRAFWFGVVASGLAIDLIYLFYDRYWTDKSVVILTIELILLFGIAIGGIINAIQVIKGK